MVLPIVPDFDALHKVLDGVASSAFYFMCRVYDFDPFLGLF